MAIKQQVKKALLVLIAHILEKKKSDKCLTIYIPQGVAKCFHCESLSFRDETEVEETYVLPQQNWRNYTKLSDKLVKWLEDVRKIKQSTAIELGWTEEKYYQPSLQKRSRT